MWPSPQFLADLVTFTEEHLDPKLHFLCSKGLMWQEDYLGDYLAI